MPATPSGPWIEPSGFPTHVSQPPPTPHPTGHSFAPVTGTPVTAPSRPATSKVPVTPVGHPSHVAVSVSAATHPGLADTGAATTAISVVGTLVLLAGVVLARLGRRAH